VIHRYPIFCTRSRSHRERHHDWLSLACCIANILQRLDLPGRSAASHFLERLLDAAIACSSPGSLCLALILVHVSWPQQLREYVLGRGDIRFAHDVLLGSPTQTNRSTIMPSGSSCRCLGAISRQLTALVAVSVLRAPGTRRKQCRPAAVQQPPAHGQSRPPESRSCPDPSGRRREQSGRCASRVPDR